MRRSREEREEDFDAYEGEDAGLYEAESYGSPGGLGGAGGYGVEAPVGAAPLWPAAAAHGEVISCRIMRQDEQGQFWDIGALPANFTMETLVVFTRKAGYVGGIFKLIPLNVEGQPVRVITGGVSKEYSIQRIDPNHALYRTAGQVVDLQAVQAGALAAPVVTHDAAAMEIVREEMRALREQLADEKREKNDLFERMQTKLADIHAKEAGLAEIHVDRSMELQSRVIDAADERRRSESEALMNQTAILMQQSQTQFQNVITMMQTIAAQNQKAAELALERERQSAEIRGQREREEYMLAMEREDRRRERESREREERWERQRSADREDSRRRTQQEQEYRTMVLEMQEKNDPVKSIKRLIGEAAPIAAALGFDTQKITGLLGLGAGKSTVETIVGEIGATVRELVKSPAAEGLIEQVGTARAGGGEPEYVLVVMPDGSTRQLTVEEARQIAEEQAAAAAGGQGRAVAVQAPQGAPMAPQQGAPRALPAPVPDFTSEQMASQSLEAEMATSPWARTADAPAGPQGSPAPAPPPLPAITVPVEASEVAALPLPVKAAGRRNARQLVAKLGMSSQDQWLALIAEYVTADENALALYLAACGVQSAALEAGANPQLAAEIVALVTPLRGAHPSIPADLKMS
jgi:hypothetical protein